ncbi:tropomyosin [Lophiostoma macrostomum CBS 122681]|uniref:Tropomyosin n=1 Tax=Lophiostoma macrostomum CBS 122681 TaxID=1314788 RepID=A0A6A6TCE1_9PLEO|nr:tropomyosin [Lophiostoma macrostomum CBS 122681]
MERIRQRMDALRLEADDSAAKAEEYKAKVKTLDTENTQKEQEITSLTHKNQVLEAEVEKLEGQVKTFKDEAGAGAGASSQVEAMQRKIQVLEEEAEESDRTIRELNEKLRQTDVKSGHFERKVQALEQTRDQWETKYEEMAKKYADAQKRIDDFANELGDL